MRQRTGDGDTTDTAERYDPRLEYRELRAGVAIRVRSRVSCGSVSRSLTCPACQGSHERAR